MLTISLGFPSNRSRPNPEKGGDEAEAALLYGVEPIIEWFVFIYPPEVIQQHGDAKDWRNLVGTGPFMLTDHVEGSSLTYTKNPNYWGYDAKFPENRLPYIDRLRVLEMKEEATRLAALRSGKLDLVGGPGNSPIKSMDQAESLGKTNPDLVQWPHSCDRNPFII